MLKLGEVNKAKVIRKTEYGYFLDAETGNTKDDVLLPIKNLVDKDCSIEINDEIDVFIYRDSSKRLVATLKTPKLTVGNVGLLKVCDVTDIGVFVDIGVDRDVLVPFREKKYPLFLDKEYPFYLYVDKSGRLAATTDIEEYLRPVGNSWKEELGEKNGCLTGYVFGFQTNKTALVYIKPDILGVVLYEEYYTDIKEGDILENLKVIKLYEDGKLGLTTRGNRIDEMTLLESKILSYMEGNDGFMRFNDKSKPEEIRIVFNTSKKNFKRTLGTMMKKELVIQDEAGTKLKI